MKKLLSILGMLAYLCSYAQEGANSLIPAERIQYQKTQGQNFKAISLFEVAAEKNQHPFFSDQRIQKISTVSPKKEALDELLYSRPDFISLSLPMGAKEEVRLELMKVNLVTEDFKLHTVSGQIGEMPNTVFYRGIVADDPNSLAVISILGDEVKGLFSNSKYKNVVLSKISESKEETLHALYQDHDLLREQAFECGTEDSGLGYTVEELQASSSEKSLSGCVRIYFEVDHDIYQDKGSLDEVGKFVMGIFSEVAILYANENVNVEVSEIRVWDQTSPYSGSSSSEMLDQFQQTRTSFNGDLGQLLSYQASGGIAVLRGLCHPYTRARLSFASVRSAYKTYPSYSYTVMVVAHELGHLLGSQHTHACVWNGNNTAIDGCAGFTEGSCSTPSVPSGGGTIMSYCHITQAGINFNLGFGDQPGNVIRNFVDNASCVQACSSPGGGGDDGPSGGDPSECTDVNLTLRLDTYSPETSWELKNSNGVVLYQGGPYGKEFANKTVETTFCLTDGCYNFNIKDAYNDGICCEFGQGRYELKDGNGNDLGSGSEFGSNQTQKFCVENGGGAGDDGDCTVIDFNQYSIDPYGGLQDIGDFEIQDGGNVLKISNNAWKSIDLNYTITPNTVLAFDFRSDQEGEIHGIGFDDNDQISYSRTFKVHGIQNWGILNYDNYSGSAWKTYNIPVGQFYRGNYNRLFFVADHDGGRRNGDSYFRKVRIYEDVDCLDQQMPLTLEMGGQSGQFQLYPNPSTNEVQLDFDVPAGSVAKVTVFNLLGQSVDQLEWDAFEGAQTETIPVGHLPPGTYLLELQAGDQRYSTKFSVTR